MSQRGEYEHRASADGGGYLTMAGNPPLVPLVLARRWALVAGGICNIPSSSLLEGNMAVVGLTSGFHRDHPGDSG